MQLTQVLLKNFPRIPFPVRRTPKGNIFRGKYRIVPNPKPQELAKLRLQMQIEERNMFYLRHPYLTHKEYAGVGETYLKTKETFLRGCKERQMDRFKKTVENRTITKHLSVLNTTDRWE